jgi:hypothetical protein
MLKRVINVFVFFIAIIFTGCDGSAESFLISAKYIDAKTFNITYLESYASTDINAYSMELRSAIKNQEQYYFAVQTKNFKSLGENKYSVDIIIREPYFLSGDKIEITYLLFDDSTIYFDVP